MNQVLRVLSKIGEYIYRNSVWLVPLVETTYKAMRKIIKRKKDERTTENKNQESSGEN
jgi:uncharacterized protein YktA (UPF0223 family)